MVSKLNNKGVVFSKKYVFWRKIVIFIDSNKFQNVEGCVLTQKASLQLEYVK